MKVKVKMSDAGKLVGRYIVLWRMDSLQPCKVVSVSSKEFKITYELVSGPDKGKRFFGHYDPAQTVQTFPDERAVLAHVGEENQQRSEKDEKFRRKHLKEDIKRAMDILKDCLSRI